MAAAARRGMRDALCEYSTHEGIPGQPLRNARAGPRSHDRVLDRYPLSTGSFSVEFDDVGVGRHVHVVQMA